MPHADSFGEDISITGGDHKMYAAGKSVTGLLRKNNEDSIYISDNDCKLKYVYIVADGMGGHKAGEVASRYSIEIFKEFINSRSDEELEEENILDTLVEAVSICNRKLYEKSVQYETLEGMGTTFTCAVLKNNSLYAVHVGDSRAYIFSKGSLRQITRDHSFVMEMVKQGKLTLEEAERHPNKNVITRAVGSEKTVLADTVIEKLSTGDLVLLCSDGLTNMVSDKKITEVFESGGSAELMLDRLIDAANDMGGNDNISAVIIDMR